MQICTKFLLPTLSMSQPNNMLPITPPISNKLIKVPFTIPESLILTVMKKGSLIIIPYCTSFTHAKMVA